MNYQTKLAAAANDYDLGIKVAHAAMEKEALSMDDVKSSLMGAKDRVGAALSSAGSSVSDAAHRYARDVREPLLAGTRGAISMAREGENPAAMGDLLRQLAPGAARELAGHRGVQTAGALAGLGGLGVAGMAGLNKYKQHKRNQMLKRLAMGGGAAALGLGGLGLASHLMHRDEE